ncbi:phenoloxidase-activating factor 1-like [Diabrotica undecimpunctata]|uniref:phenoloxidase-activating factor 1-like n=1 Tax=Diabrotica undecimpunctata TaxID=50387 RepID=UPI003B63E344
MVQQYIAVCALFFVFVCYVHADYRIDCISPNKENTKCESIYKCKTFTDALKSTVTQSQKDFMQESLCGYYDNLPIVCCGTQSDYTDSNRPPKRTKRNTDFKTNSLILETQCGVLVNDHLTSGQPQDFPWAVKLIYNQTLHRCEGTLIHKRYVLTSGQCVNKFIVNYHGKLAKVTLGLSNCPDEKSCTKTELNVGIDGVTIHKDFGIVRGVPHDDIALIRLDKDITFNDNIFPICLPQQHEEAEVGDKVTEVGWLKKSPIKLGAKLTIVDTKLCQEYYKVENYNITVTEKNVCAGGYEKKICTGVSGSSLARLTSRNTYVLEGIRSFGPRTCGDTVPTVYTKVQHYLQWIHDNIKN